MSVPLDPFPGHCGATGLTGQRASISEGLPLGYVSAAPLNCQEGTEHFADQLGALQEFNRILKQDGILVLTTPDYSNLRSKVSYLLAENERNDASK